MGGNGEAHAAMEDPPPPPPKPSRLLGLLRRTKTVPAGRCGSSSEEEAAGMAVAATAAAEGAAPHVCASARQQALVLALPSLDGGDNPAACTPPPSVQHAALCSRENSGRGCGAGHCTTWPTFADSTPLAFGPPGGGIAGLQGQEGAGEPAVPAGFGSLQATINPLFSVAAADAGAGSLRRASPQSSGSGQQGEGLAVAGCVSALRLLSAGCSVSIRSYRAQELAPPHRTTALTTLRWAAAVAVAEQPHQRGRAQSPPLLSRRGRQGCSRAAVAATAAAAAAAAAARLRPATLCQPPRPARVARPWMAAAAAALCWWARPRGARPPWSAPRLSPRRERPGTGRGGCPGMGWLGCCRSPSCSGSVDLLDLLPLIHARPQK